MGFMEEMVGFEERFAALVDILCVIIGGIFAVFALVSAVGNPEMTQSFAGVAMSFLLFPLVAGKVFPHEQLTRAPPPLLKPKAKK